MLRGLERFEKTILVPHHFFVRAASRKTWRLKNHQAVRLQKLHAAPHRGTRVGQMLENVEVQDEIQTAWLDILLLNRTCKHRDAKRGLRVFHQPRANFQTASIKAGPTH